MPQALMVVSPPSKFYTVSTIVFHKYGGVNFAFTNCMSHFSMFAPTNATVKLANGSTGHAQGIEIILYLCTKCYTINPVETVYYCPGQPSKTISLDALECYVGFQKVTSEPIEHCNFVDPQGRSWKSPHQTQNNLEFLQIETVKVNYHIDRNIVVPNVCELSNKTNISEYFP